MSEILNRKELFINGYASISLEKVCLIKVNKVFNFNEIACIEVKKNQAFLVYKRFYLRVMFTNATSVEFLIKRIEVNKAIKFVTAFSNIRSFNSDIN